MNTSTSTAELNDLEIQIDSLIQNLERLKSDNQLLRHQLATSASERSHLQKKNQQATAKIRTIISQLKEQMS